MVDEEKGDLLIWRIDEDLEFDQLKNIFEDVKYNFDRIIIGASKSKLKKVISSLKLRPLVEKEEGGAMAILIKPRERN